MREFKRIKEGELDELVYDDMSRRASEINNGGVKAQIELLTREFGLSEKQILQYLATGDYTYA